MDKIGGRDLDERCIRICQSFIILNDNYQYHIPARQHWKVKNRSVGHHKRLDSQSQLVATSTRFATKCTILSPKNTYDLRVKGHTILIFFSKQCVIVNAVARSLRILCLVLASKFHRCRGVANGGAGGADCPPGHQKSGRRAKIGKGKKGERKEKRGKGREKRKGKEEERERKGKGKGKGEEEEKKERKGKEKRRKGKREEKGERKRGKKGKRKERKC